MFGLESATAEALEGLGASVREIYEKTQNLNDKKIQLKCSEVQRRVEVRQHALRDIYVYMYIVHYTCIPLNLAMMNPLTIAGKLPYKNFSY